MQPQTTTPSISPAVVAQACAQGLNLARELNPGRDPGLLVLGSLVCALGDQAAGLQEMARTARDWMRGSGGYVVS